MDIIKELKLKHRIRDPLYGYVRLNDLELQIIDLPIFQRLRRISQLALTKYVYPSAEHSRFVHSLGVLEAVTRILIEILHRDDGHGYSLNDIQEIRLAALLHDIGHLPFSHATEDILLDNGKKHEDISIKIIETYQPLKNIIEQNSIRLNNIIEIITKKDNNKKYDLISGAFDADRADYLRRDSYMCGVEYGNYDFIRYISSLKYNGLTEQYIINEDDIYTVESFIAARYNYNQQVVYHRTRVGYNIVIREYIKELLLRNIENINKIDIDNLNLDKFIWFDDYTFIEQAKKDIQNTLLQGNTWAEYFLRLKHLKCIEQIHVYGNPNSTDFANQNKDKIKILNDICNKYEQKEKVFVEISKNNIIKLRKGSNELDDETKSLYGVKLRYSNSIVDIVEYSPVLKRFYEEYSETRRFYCKPENYEEIIKYIEEKRGKRDGKTNTDK